MRGLRLSKSNRASRLVLAAGLAGFGSQLATLSAAWVLVQARASPVLIAVLYACGSAPQLLVGLPAGVLGDRIGHRVSVVWSGLAAAVVVATLAAAVAITTPRVPVVLAAAALLACADTLRQANLQALSGPPRGPASLASLNWVSRAATLGGALSGGGLYSVAGPAWVFTLAAIAYAAASLVLRGQSNAAPTTSTRAPHGLRTAARLLRTEPMVRDLFFLMIGIETFLFSPFAVLPTFTHQVLGGGSESLGLLTACASAGGVIVLTGLRTIAGTRYRRLLLGSFVVGPLALVGQSARASLITASVMLVVLGAALACIDVASQALMQLLGPDDQRGALGGLWVVAVGSAPLGQIGSGLVASALGARAAVAVFGGVALTLGVAARRMTLFRVLRSDPPASADV
jgi:MFS family permease